MKSFHKAKLPKVSKTTYTISTNTSKAHISAAVAVINSEDIINDNSGKGVKICLNLIRLVSLDFLIQRNQNHSEDDNTQEWLLLHYDPH